jgi:Skp family chaperone for outer membrane proteins
MKHTLRYCFVLLALATTGMFAEAAAAPVDTAAISHHKTFKVAKKGGGKKTAAKKHKKHKRKAAK